MVIAGERAEFSRKWTQIGGLLDYGDGGGGLGLPPGHDDLQLLSRALGSVLTPFRSRDALGLASVHLAVASPHA